MSERIAMSYTESLQDMVSRYRTSGQKWPATSREIARWSYRNNCGSARKEHRRPTRSRYFAGPARRMLHRPARQASANQARCKAS